MTKLEIAARHALEALLDAQDVALTDMCYHDEITALREALKPTREGKYYYKDNACTADNADSPDCICWHDEALAEQAEQEPILLSPSCAERGCACFDDRVDGEPVTAYLAPVQPVMQEPVAWARTSESGDVLDCISDQYKTTQPCTVDYDEPLYAAPVRTKDLTDDEIFKCLADCDCLQSLKFARAVIAADREKNK